EIAPIVRSGLACVANRGGPKDRNDHVGPSGLNYFGGDLYPDLTVGAISCRPFGPGGGFAAAQCGKALPFRSRFTDFRGYASNGGTPDIGLPQQHVIPAFQPAADCQSHTFSNSIAHTMTVATETLSGA